MLYWDTIVYLNFLDHNNVYAKQAVPLTTKPITCESSQFTMFGRPAK